MWDNLCPVSISMKEAEHGVSMPALDHKHNTKGSNDVIEDLMIVLCVWDIQPVPRQCHSKVLFHGNMDIIVYGLEKVKTI